jgi:hypothetical protein
MSPTPVLALALAAALPAGGPSPAQAASPTTASRIDLAECRKLVDEGKAVIVDVRDATAYGASHIAGALSIPLDTVAAKAGELKKQGKAVIAYCG